MSARCESCKHWQNPWDEVDAEVFTDPDYDNLVPVADVPRWGTCDLIGLAKRGPVSVTAFTKDGSNYMADLHTRADFGCTLHEAKD